MHSLVRSREHESTAVMIAVVCGKAGAGKTTLAIHAAHKLRALFTDGQLYVNLHGAQAQALDPAHVLSRFLRAFAVGECSIPDDVDERAGLYRSLMADRRVLVLLDNALTWHRFARCCPVALAISCWSPAAPSLLGLPSLNGFTSAPSRRNRRWNCSPRSQVRIALPENPMQQRRSRHCAAICRWRSAWRGACSPQTRLAVAAPGRSARWARLAAGRADDG